MELLTIQHIAEAAPRHIITACEDTDTCPGCGAGYRVGLSECEYCRTPVRLSIEGDGYAIGGMVPKDMRVSLDPCEYPDMRRWQK